MKKLNILKITAYSFFLALLATSCVPESDVEEAAGVGSTLVKITPAEFSLTAIDAVSTEQNAVLFEVRRDAKSASALKKTTTVTLQLDVDQTMIDAYNTKHETSFELLPSTLYSLNYTPSATGLITVNFAAGDHTKPLWIKIPDANQFDFSAQYMLAFKVAVTGEGTWTTTAIDTMYCQVLAKNKFDGIYEVRAVTPMLDILNAAFTTYEPFDYHLETTGQYTCLCVDKTVWDAPMHPMTNAGATSGYGSFGLELEFDVDGNIVAVYNPWGNPPGNTRMPVMDPSGENKWNPSTKNIRLKYFMIQPSLVPAAPHIRVYFDEMWTYKGPR